jgi:S-adenosyl methyltransferase
MTPRSQPRASGCAASGTREVPACRVSPAGAPARFASVIDAHAILRRAGQILLLRRAGQDLNGGDAGAARAAWENRAFLRRAVTYPAKPGVIQLLDIGTGLPTEGIVREIAQRVNPGARVLYVEGRSCVSDQDRAVRSQAFGYQPVQRPGAATSASGLAILAGKTAVPVGECHSAVALRAGPS